MYGEMPVKRDRIAHSLTQRLPKVVMAGAVYAKTALSGSYVERFAPSWVCASLPLICTLFASEVAYIVHDCDANMK